MNSTDLRIAIHNYETDNGFAPRSILVTNRQLSQLLASDPMLQFFDRERMNKFMGIPIAVTDSQYTLDVRPRNGVKE